MIDFGCATTEEGILYDWPGTVPYLAPEQREGERHGHQVDYWACALVGVKILGYVREEKRRNKQVNPKDYKDM